MRFAALVAFVVVASTVPGLAAPAGNSHPQVTSKRDDSIAVGVHFKKSPDEVIDGSGSLGDVVLGRTNSNNTKRQTTRRPRQAGWSTVTVNGEH
ncbi:hypothetical protein DEU56DRAFT_982612 [Suillus clintonianus]|uniref:uncharacterized protein n=1 Tax=Suillus clintonianus TaxID=1904413 RepID=UPI001B85D7B8|nr:uncharacterized protein DEU56DRAFT_982612 [Suillus clintonianus]KAG2128293.1 hypothetical protein DEU56DRAFT_982612 [Suillus clintonianus]